MIPKPPAEEVFKKKTGDIVALLVDNNFAVGLTTVKHFYRAIRGKSGDPAYREIWFSIRCKAEATYRRETSKYEFGVDIPDIDSIEAIVPSTDTEIFIFIIVAGEEKVYVTTNKFIHRFGRKWQDDVTFPKGIYFIERTRCMTMTEFKMWLIDWLSPRTDESGCDISPESHIPPVGFRVFHYSTEYEKAIEFMNDPAYLITARYISHSPESSTDRVYLFYELREKVDEDQKRDLNRLIQIARTIKESQRFEEYEELKNATAREMFLLHHFDVNSRDAPKVMELLKDSMASIVGVTSTSTTAHAPATLTKT